MRDYWDDSTEALYSDLCDLLAHQLRTAVDEKPPYAKFEGELITTRNPGWLNAALIISDLIAEPDNVSHNLKDLLFELKGKLEPILTATRKLIEEENEDSEELEGLDELYTDLLNKIENLTM